MLSISNLIYNSNIEYRVLTKIENIHWEDINALAIKVNGVSDNLIITGGDDAIINIFDKRLLGDESHQAVGKFFGHNSGITSIDITDNCTYIASNGKDQWIKLWDVRKMNPPSVYSKINRKSIDYDYRNTKWDKSKEFIHEADNSIYTFRGHTTHFTHIKWSFSPQAWTDQRFIACGSFWGCTVIYDTFTGEKLGSLISNSKLISKVPVWHPKQRKLICSYEDAIKVYEYDHSHSAFKKLCVGKVNLSTNLSKRFNKHQKEVEESYNNFELKKTQDP